MNKAFMPDAARPPLRPAAIKSSGHQNALKIVLAIFALMIVALLGMVVLLLIGAETGLSEMIIGLICATLPVPIYVMLVLWIDRYESEPLWMLATAFLWGAVIAVLVAFIFNTGLSIMAAAATNDARVGQNFGAVISAPIVEESAKACILVVLFLPKGIAGIPGMIGGLFKHAPKDPVPPEPAVAESATEQPVVTTEVRA